MMEQELVIKTFSANLQLNSYNVRTEIWPDMRHTNMKSSE